MQNTNTLLKVELEKFTVYSLILHSPPFDNYCTPTLCKLHIVKLPYSHR